jgi:phosphatidylinositol phospholipase C beta
MLEIQLNFADQTPYISPIHTGKTEKLVYQTLADCGLPNEKGQSIDPAAFTFDVFYQIYQAICPR